MRLADRPSRSLRLARACAAIVLIASAFSACGGSGSTPGPTPLPTPALPLQTGRYVVTFVGPPRLFAPDGSHTAGCQITGGVTSTVATTVRLQVAGSDWVGTANDAAGGDFNLRFGAGPLDDSFPSGLDAIGLSGSASGLARDTVLGVLSAALGQSRVVLGTPSAPARLRGGAARVFANLGRPLAEGVIDGTVVFHNERGDSSSCESGTVRWMLAPTR